MRYTIELDEEAERGVDRLKAAYGLKTKADVYQLAIRLLNWATEQQVEGHEVGRYTKAEEFQPLLMPNALRKEVWLNAAEAVKGKAAFP